MADNSKAGPVKAWPGRLLRWEGAALSAATIWAYRRAGGSWWFFASGILVPDLSMVGYFSDPATGAALYNIGHSEILPVLLLCTGLGQQSPRFVNIALIWLAHINRKVPRFQLIRFPITDQLFLCFSGQNDWCRTQIPDRVREYPSWILGWLSTTEGISQSAVNSLST